MRDGGSRGKEHVVAVLDRLQAEPDGEVGLADARRAEEHDVLAVLAESGRVPPSALLITPAKASWAPVNGTRR